jgi:hypothetical protein
MSVGGRRNGCGGVSYTNWGGFPIQYVSWCILHVSCMYSEGYMYPECILMYLKCILHALLHSKRIHVSWHFACISHVSQTSPRYILGYTSDTSRYMYLGRFLGVTLDTCQDTSGYVYLLDSSSRYIRIHRDTKSRYMYLGRDTCGIQSETHTSNISSEVRNWDARYMRDTFEIHSGYMYLQRWSRYMRDTPEIHHEIHVSQMHPEIDVSDMKETCGIRAGYMQHTCILEGNQDTYGIHMGYTFGIHAWYVSLGLRGMYLVCHVSEG